MTDLRMFPAGTPLSPSGCIVASPCGRRALKQGPLPKGRCWWCAGEVRSPRRVWCSSACADEMYDRDPNILRARVMKRDRGKPCAACGCRGGSEVDHTVPIVEGGHPWDMANLRKLCEACHRFETRCLSARRASARRTGAAGWQPCERRPGNGGRPQCLASLTEGWRACVCDRTPRRRCQAITLPLGFNSAPNDAPRALWHDRHAEEIRRRQVGKLVRMLCWWARRIAYERRPLEVAPAQPNAPSAG